MVWKENRVTYQNLKANDSLNALTQEDIQRLWLPKVIYENTDQKDTTRLGSNWEWETNVEVKRQGNFTMSGFDVVDEAYIYQGLFTKQITQKCIKTHKINLFSFNFQGDENSLIMTQTYTNEFQCQYDFRLYPFDTQVATISPCS